MTAERAHPPSPRDRWRADLPPGHAEGPGSRSSRALPQISCPEGRASLDDLDDLARADGAATLADGEAEALLHRDGLDEVHVDLGVVAGHDHLGALGQRDDAGD